MFSSVFSGINLSTIFGAYGYWMQYLATTFSLFVIGMCHLCTLVLQSHDNAVFLYALRHNQVCKSKILFSSP